MRNFVSWGRLAVLSHIFPSFTSLNDDVVGLEGGEGRGSTYAWEAIFLFK